MSQLIIHHTNSYDDLKNLPMYKLNKQWIEKMKNEGYEVINIGTPPHYRKFATCGL